jgi:uncharacterized YccA/Bax inhibitor family protein
MPAAPAGQSEDSAATLPDTGRMRSYRKAARQTIGMSIAPYGYTLTVWTSGAVLTHARGIPTTVDALLFMLGAVGGFALVGIAAFGTHRAHVRVEPQQPQLWAGFHVLSVGASIGAGALIAHLVQNSGAWPLGGFVATTIYLVVLTAQLALAA